MAKILVVDDEQNLRGALKLLLELEGYTVETASNGLEGLEAIHQDNFDLVISDVRMPKMDGLEMLKEIRKTNSLLPVILITAFASIDDVITAIQEKAVNYIKKPFENSEVLHAVKKELVEKNLRYEIAYLRDEIDQSHPYKNIIGHSKPMQSVFELIRRVAPSKSTVLITGETGTGKELIARAIHDNSPRRDKPLIKVNCIAIPDTLLESELFGHVKGAFTDASYTKPGKFELADGGTIFLDEIGDMSLSLQGKILRVLQEREYEAVGGTSSKKVDVRIIAATNRNLRELVKKGTFREDLYFRLNVVPIHIPPLRQRKEDIAALVQHFINKYSLICGKEVKQISPDVTTFLQEYDYPGNVRDLENLIERAVVLCIGNKLELSDFQLGYQLPVTTGLNDDSLMDLTYREAKKIILERFETQYFTALLKATGANLTKAAKIADMDRKNFRDKIQQYGIQPQDISLEDEQ